VSKGVSSCGSSGCHKPGALGHTDPFPEPLGEHVAPPYYDPIFSSLMSSCVDEDMPLDGDSDGLDNDGDGLVDSADPECAEVSTTTTTTTIIPTTTTTMFGCGPAPAIDCIAAGKGVLLVNEKTAGKEKSKLVLSKLQAAVPPRELGDPFTGTTDYEICIYDADGRLAGTYTIARAGALCGNLSCWSTMSKGYKYTDKTASADGIVKMKLTGGDTGKGKLQLLGKNTAATLPTGIAASLQGQPRATVQVITSDAACFGMALPQVKKADGRTFSAVGP